MLILLKLLKADAPYEEIKHALLELELELEKRWLREAKNRQESLNAIAHAKEVATVSRPTSR